MSEDNMRANTWSPVAVVMLAAGLAGCFTADQSLIETGETPFAEISFQADGDDDVNVMTRDGDGYRVESGGSVLTMRFTAIGDNVYLAEVTGDDDGSIVRLYGGVRFDPATGRAEAYRILGEEEDAGPGLRLCEDDAICIDDLAAYADLVRQDIAAGEEPDVTYSVTAVE